MARIRTIKPSFFRHEGLQDLEAANPKKYTMMVFAGLWGHCDKGGCFQWRPRMLKLDILPFLNFEMSETLKLLEVHGFIRRYEVDGEAYGVIDSFMEHQRIHGKEAQEEQACPVPPALVKQQGNNGEATGKQQGNNGEAVETAGREGKGREQEKEGNGIVPASMTLERVVEVWNVIPGVGQAKSVTGPIRERVCTRLKEHPDLEWWRTLFDRVKASDFLCGRKTDFAVTLDWILGPKNLAKLMNGNYDNRLNLQVVKPTSMVDYLKHQFPDRAEEA